MATKRGKNSNRLLNEAMALATIVNEQRRGKSGRGKAKGSRGKKMHPHGSVPDSKPCSKCGKWHSKSEHASHGRGSFARTHGDSTYRLGRELHLAGAEDLLGL